MTLKFGLNKEDRHVEAFAQFWTSLAKHLSTRDPERVFLEVINEPMVEDPYRWYGIQAKLIAAIRSGAPEHTSVLVVTGGRAFTNCFRSSLTLIRISSTTFIFTNRSPLHIKVRPGPETTCPIFRGALPCDSRSCDADTGYRQRRAGSLRFCKQYSESGWNAERIDREIGTAAAWAAKRHVFLTCNEFGAFRRFASSADRATGSKTCEPPWRSTELGWTMWDYAGSFGVVTKQNGEPTADELVVKALGLHP
jgi:hypothetical protein